VVGVLGKDKTVFSTYSLNWYGKGENTAVHFKFHMCKEQKHCKYFLNLFSQKIKVSYTNKDLVELGFYYAHLSDNQRSAESSTLIFTSREARHSDINSVTVTYQLKEITETSPSPSISPSHVT